MIYLDLGHDQSESGPIRSAIDSSMSRQQGEIIDDRLNLTAWLLLLIIKLPPGDHKLAGVGIYFQVTKIFPEI